MFFLILIIILMSRCIVNVGGNDSDVGCGQAGYPSNGIRVIENANFEHKSTHSCNRGFHLIGSSVRYCNGNGTWSPAIPKCAMNQSPFVSTNVDGDITTCNLQFGHGQLGLYVDLGSAVQLTDIYLDIKTQFASNIFVFATNNSFNIFSTLTDRKTAVCAFHAVPHVSTYKCKHLNIKTKFLVLESSDMMNVCEVTALDANEIVKCGQPDEPLHGKIVDSNSNITIYECEQNYELQGAKSNRCVDGAWEYQMPLCSKNAQTLTTTFQEFTTPRLKADNVNNKNHKVVQNNFVIGIAVGIAFVCIFMLGLYFVRQCYIKRKSKGGCPINHHPSFISQLSNPSNGYVPFYGSVGEEEYTYLQTQCPANAPDVCPRRNNRGNSAQIEEDYLYPMQLEVNNLSSNVIKEIDNKTNK